VIFYFKVLYTTTPPAHPSPARWANGNKGVAGPVEKSVGPVVYLGYEFACWIGFDMAKLEIKDEKFVAPSEQSCAVGLATAEVTAHRRVLFPILPVLAPSIAGRAATRAPRELAHPELSRCIPSTKARP